MNKRELRYVYKNYRVGQKIVVEDADFNKIEVTIQGLYPRFCLVTDGKTKWCVAWQDIYIDRA